MRLKRFKDMEVQLNGWLRRNYSDDLMAFVDFHLKVADKAPFLPNPISSNSTGHDSFASISAAGFLATSLTRSVHTADHERHNKLLRPDAALEASAYPYDVQSMLRARQIPRPARQIRRCNNFQPQARRRVQSPRPLGVRKLYFGDRHAIGQRRGYAVV